MDFTILADAWARDDRSVLDKITAPQRRALGLIAAGAVLEDKQAEAAGAEFVRGVKASPLFRLGSLATKAEDAGENRLRWVFSDETVDRAGDIIRQNWELGNYKNNPVVLWGHGRDEDEPIGRTVEIGVTGKKLIGTIEFATAESERAARLFRLARGGFISAGSVGFRPLKTEHIEDPAEREKLGLGRWGAVFTRSELLEYSLCAVPCNPNALQESKLLQVGDADLLHTITVPTEREWESYVRRHARAFVKDEPEAPSLLVAAIEAFTEVMRSVASTNDMLARSITDLSARTRVADATTKARGGLTDEDSAKLLKQLRDLKNN